MTTIRLRPPLHATAPATALAVAAALAAAWPRPARAQREDTGGAADRELAREARLPTILAIVEQQNPDLLEAGARAEAAEARAGAAGRLPDLELKGELWGVPITRPLGFDQANTIMIGLRQAFPAWGSLDAQARAAREEALASGDAARARRQEMVAQARRAYAGYLRADREQRLHLEHVGLTSQLLELARGYYAVGRGAQQDLLRAQAELSRLHVDVATIDQQRRSAQAMLNALMGRAADAPLGPTPDVDVTGLLGAAARAAAPDDDWGLDQRRPELQAAERAVRRGQAMLDGARREASLPTLMVGADYWYMPTAPFHHGYGAMVAVSLPWLNPRHRDEVRAAERSLVADRHALQAQQASARFQVRDAAARVDAARDTLAILHQRVLPDARRSYESAVALFRAGQGSLTPVLEAQQAYLQARIDEVRAIADVESSRADFDRAAGLPAQVAP